MSDEPRDGRSRRARRLREQRRREILDAALVVFARDGYHAAAVSEIIQEAGVARGTFYRYFASKLAVFEELMDGLISELMAGIVDVDVRPGAPPALLQLEHNVLWLLGQVQARPELLQILLWEAVGADEALDRKLDSFHEKVFELTRSSLQTGMRVGLVRPCDPEVTARFVVGALKELLLSLLIRKDLDASDPQRIARELLAFISAGILVPGIAGS